MQHFTTGFLSELEKFAGNKRSSKKKRAAGIGTGALTGAAAGVPAGLLGALALMALRPTRYAMGPKGAIRNARYIFGKGLRKDLEAMRKDTQRRAAKGIMVGAGTGAAVGGLAGHEISKHAARLVSQMTPQSSNVKGFSYDPKNQSLLITYKSGGTYRYKGVPPAVARSMRRSKSVGKAVHRRVKGGGYDYEKVGLEIANPVSMVTDTLDRHEEPISLMLGTALGASSGLTLGAALGGGQFAKGLSAKLNHPNPKAGGLRKIIHAIRKLPKSSKMRRALVRDLRRGGVIGGATGLVAGGLFGRQVSKGHRRQKEMRRDLDKLRVDVNAISKSAAEEQKCLRRTEALIKKDPSLTLMMGPPDKAYDTRHFWAETPEGLVKDPSRRNYPYYAKGKPFREKTAAKKKQKNYKCKFCKDPATKGIIWAEGRAIVPCCDKHLAKGKVSLDDPKDIDLIRDLTKHSAMVKEAPKNAQERFVASRSGSKNSATAKYYAKKRREAREKRASAGDAIAYRLAGTRRQVAKLAGVAKKQVTWQGLTMKLEYLKGDERSGVNGATGKKWSRTMKDHYGYMPGTYGKGADGDAIDIYLSPDAGDEVATGVFKIRQKKKTGEYDEDKFMVGYASADDARKAFLRNMPEWAMGSMNSVSMKAFMRMVGQ